MQPAQLSLMPEQIPAPPPDVIVSLPEEKKPQNVTVVQTQDGKATRPEF